MARSRLRRRLAWAGVLAFLPGLASADVCPGTDLRDALTVGQAEALQAAEAVTPFPRGNHWRATRDDRAIHLIGTIHIPDARLDPVVDRLAPVIEGAELMFLEATAEDQTQLERDMATDTSLLLLQDTSLPELMAEEDWQRLAEAARARGLPGFMAAKMRPWYLSMLMALPPCAMHLLAEGEGLDARVEALAREAGVERRSLESYTTVFEAFNAEPVDQQLRMLQVGTYPDDLGADLLETTVAAYFDEAHSDAWEISRLMTVQHLDLPEAEIEEMMDDMARKLLIDRNLAWIEVIEAAEARDIVVAVGAAHLMGESGLLNQLQDRGYLLERQAF